MPHLPEVQLALRPGIIEFGWGHPDNALLPVEGLRQAAVAALGANGTGALAYGAEQGPGQLIELICQRLGVIDGSTPAPERLLITGGISHALDLLCTLLTQPGDIA